MDSLENTEKIVNGQFRKRANPNNKITLDQLRLGNNKTSLLPLNAKRFLN